MAQSPELPLSRRHSYTAAALFRLKAAGLRLRRSLQDTKSPLVRHQKPQQALPLLLAESQTALWTSPVLSERRLQLGKAQNLRIAARRLDGIVVPAGEVFSFWRQLGKATTQRGFVAGRELREGCLVPSVGGGLCQLSNALYELALTTHCEIIERHAHSRIVPGSAAALGRDATVFWNYLDLRFAPSVPVRIEARLTAESLILRFWSDQRPQTNAARTFQRLELLTPTPRGCDSCGVGECDQHSTPEAEAAREQLGQKTAFILEERWPELARWVGETKRPDDILLLPMARGRYAWETAGFSAVHTATIQTLLRSLETRKKLSPPQRRAAQLAGAGALAETLGRQLPYDATHVVVSQSLLPYLWEAGWLGGRTFDVLLTRVPLAVLHKNLDAALAQRPEARLLGDFRAPDALVEAERAALAAARHVITPHATLAMLFPERAQKLPWHLPTVAASWKPGSGRVIAFAGPTAARKGAYAVREAARALQLTVRLRGSELEGEDFWDGIPTERADTLAAWLEGVRCVVQPAVAEDAPRPLLYALAAGAPVLASAACGLEGLPHFQEIPSDNGTALIHALAAFIAPSGVEKP
jgi:VanW like protein